MRCMGGSQETVALPDAACTTVREKAEVLNSYFAGVFTDEDPHGVPAAEDRSGGRELTEVHFTRQHIIDKIDKLKEDKSPGLDGVHPGS